MKKDIRKKFFLAAMVASLALLQGGVTSCSNGSDDDETTVKLKGNFFEKLEDDEADQNADWVYCEDKLTEKENGIWEGEITAVRGWDSFGVEVNGTWYGAKEGLEGSVTDAELIKDSPKNFWLATDKDGKSKVTVNLNKMTITVEAVNNSSGGDVGSGGNNSGSATTPGTGEETTTTLPTAVVLAGYVDGDEKNFNNSLATMTESSTKGVYTAEVVISNQWVNLQVVATINGNEIWYKGSRATLNESTNISEDGAGNIYCDVGTGIAKILVTVDFTKDAPTIKIETTE